MTSLRLSARSTASLMILSASASAVAILPSHSAFIASASACVFSALRYSASSSFRLCSTIFFTGLKRSFLSIRKSITRFASEMNICQIFTEIISRSCICQTPFQRPIAFKRISTNLPGATKIRRIAITSA